MNIAEEKTQTSKKGVRQRIKPKKSPNLSSKKKKKTSDNPEFAESKKKEDKRQNKKDPCTALALALSLSEVASLCN